MWNVITYPCPIDLLLPGTQSPYKASCYGVLTCFCAIDPVSSYVWHESFLTHSNEYTMVDLKSVFLKTKLMLLLEFRMTLVNSLNCIFCVMERNVSYSIKIEMVFNEIWDNRILRLNFDPVYTKCQLMIGTKEISSLWWKCHHLLHRKSWNWWLPVQPMMKISSKWEISISMVATVTLIS